MSSIFHIMYIEVEVKDIVPGVDVVGIRVGQNSIVLPNSELQRSIGRSTGIHIAYHACTVCFNVTALFQLKQLHFTLRISLAFYSTSKLLHPWSSSYTLSIAAFVNYYLLCV